MILGGPQQPPLPNIVSEARIAVLAFSTIMHDRCTSTLPLSASLLPSGSNMLLVMGITETPSEFTMINNVNARSHLFVFFVYVTGL